MTAAPVIALHPQPVPTWDALVEGHYDKVLRHAYRLTGNSHDAADLAQDVFVRVFRSLHTYSPGSMDAWLHRITTNAFLDRVRRAARIRFEELDEQGMSPGADLADTVVDGQWTPDVMAALDDLTPEFRTAVLLYYVHGYSYEEISRMLDVKLGTVRSRIHRGRSHLRVALADRAPVRRERIAS